MFILREKGWELHIFEVNTSIYTYTLMNPDKARERGEWVLTGYSHGFIDTLRKAKNVIRAESD